MASAILAETDVEAQVQSALRHWHSLSDEFVFIIEGELVLRTDEGEMPVSAGMCVGFKAGTQNGHHFVNRSGAEARFLVVGTRVSGDVATYPDDDIKWCRDAGGSYVAHKHRQSVHAVRSIGGMPAFP